jgi:hypothetical protein
MTSDEEFGEGAAGGSRVVRVPADVNRPDPILAGLTARQLIVLAVIAAGCYLAYSATRAVVPPLAAAAAGTVIGGAAFAVVTLRRDGVGVDRLAAAWARYVQTPRRLAPTPGRPVPAWAGLPAQPTVGRLRLPVSGIDPSGVLDLGADGAAVVCAASTVNLGLRTPAEQDAVAAAYGGWLNSLTGPVQIIVRADRVDLAPLIADLEDQAADLPDPGLETAALAHAEFLRDLAAEGDLLRRQVLLVLREPLPRSTGPRTGRAGGAAGPAGRAGGAAGPAGRAAIGTRVRQRAGETAAALTAAGIAVTVLEGAAAAAVLAAAADPSQPPPPPGLGPIGAATTGLPLIDSGSLPETSRR